jgi:hypothetical protein
MHVIFQKSLIYSAKAFECDTVRNFSKIWWKFLDFFGWKKFVSGKTNDAVVFSTKFRRWRFEGFKNFDNLGCLPSKSANFLTLAWKLGKLLLLNLAHQRTRRVLTNIKPITENKIEIGSVLRKLSWRIQLADSPRPSNDHFETEFHHQKLKVVHMSARQSIGLTEIFHLSINLFMIISMIAELLRQTLIFAFV